MGEKRVRGRRAPEKQHDRERVARMKLDQIPNGLWKQIRLRFPAKIRAIVDHVASSKMSLADLLALESAEHERLNAMMEEAQAKRDDGASGGANAVGFKTLAALASVQLQSRKHLRTIILSMGPGIDQRDQPVEVPAGYTLPEMATKAESTDDDEIVN